MSDFDTREAAAAGALDAPPRQPVITILSDAAVLSAGHAEVLRDIAEAVVDLSGSSAAMQRRPLGAILEQLAAVYEAPSSPETREALTDLAAWAALWAARLQPLGQGDG